LAGFGKLLSECISMAVSKTEEVLTHDYHFVIIGGGIAGVTCVETVSFSCRLLYDLIIILVVSDKVIFIKFCIIIGYFNLNRCTALFNVSSSHVFSQICMIFRY